MGKLPFLMDNSTIIYISISRMVVYPWSFIVDLPISPWKTPGALVSQLSVWMISEWPFHWSRDWLWNLLVNCRFLQNLSGLCLHLCTRISEKKQLPETMVSGGGSTYHLDHHLGGVSFFRGMDGDGITAYPCSLWYPMALIPIQGLLYCQVVLCEIYQLNHVGTRLQYIIYNNT